jgi:hypothetical protein
MSGSMAPGPPVTGAGRGLYLRFGLVMGIGFVCIYGSGHRMAGEPGRDGGKAQLCECGEPAYMLEDGSYACENGHVIRKPEKRKKGKGKGKDRR